MEDAQLIRVTATKVTELFETTRALRTSEASVQSLSARILQVQDEERRRMARDLHDNTGQELAVLSMTLDRAMQPGADVPEAIKSAREITRQIETEVRTLSYLLHPPLLDEVGLAAAVGWFADGLYKRTGIKVSLEAPPEFPRLSWLQETTLFRIVQEALGNVVRHSGSESARVELSASDSLVRVVVQDFGKGMPPEKLAAAREGAAVGVGIGGMHERVKQLGGSLNIDSGAKGTCVVAGLPLEPAEAEAEFEMEPTQESQESQDQESAPPRSATAKKRILIVDDHEITRQGIKTLLSNQNDLEVCGEAADGFEAVEKADKLRPDLIILDLALPRQGGLATLHQVRRSGNPVKVVVFSTHSFPNLVEILQTGGAQGYVEKANASKDLVRAIRDVLAGKAFYRHHLSRQQLA
jgi:CheY-like chemotaxis protein